MDTLFYRQRPETVGASTPMPFFCLPLLLKRCLHYYRLTHGCAGWVLSRPNLRCTFPNLYRRAHTRVFGLIGLTYSLWRRSESNRPHSACKALSPPLEHAPPLPFKLPVSGRLSTGRYAVGSAPWSYGESNPIHLLAKQACNP